MPLNIPLIRESFAKAKPAAMEIVARFYENLWHDYPASKALFATVDMAAQKKSLARSLTFIVDHLEEGETLTTYLRSLGGRHLAYGTLPEHYDWVGASLLKTFSEAFGVAWNGELETAWTEAYGIIKEVMLAGAAAAKPNSREPANVIPLYNNEDSRFAVKLPDETKASIRNAVRLAVQEAISREVQLAIEEELKGLNAQAIKESVRARGG